MIHVNSHALRDRNPQQLQRRDHRPSEHFGARGASLPLFRIAFVEDRVLVVERIELLRQLEQVVGENSQLERVDAAADGRR